MSPNRDPLEDDLTPAPFEVDERLRNSPEGRQQLIELTVNATWKAVRRLGHRLDQVLPTLVTHVECDKKHPGAERVLKSILLVVAVLAATWSVYRFVAATERNEALAAQFRYGWGTPPTSKGPAFTPVPAFTPAIAPDAAQAPLEPSPKAGRPPKRVRPKP